MFKIFYIYHFSKTMPKMDYQVPIYMLILNCAGKNSFMWLGPMPRVHIMDPEQIKTVFSFINDFQKPTMNPLTRLLVQGIANLEGEKWAKHRKIINPAFHLEKLKVSISFCKSERDYYFYFFSSGLITILVFFFKIHFYYYLYFLRNKKYNRKRKKLSNEAQNFKFSRIRLRWLVGYGTSILSQL